MFHHIEESFRSKDLFAASKKKRCNSFG